MGSGEGAQDCPVLQPTDSSEMNLHVRKEKAQLRAESRVYVRSVEATYALLLHPSKDVRK